MAAATKLVDGLLAAAEAFDYRLPELYSGDARDDVAFPLPHPAACRPQAWSAAAAIALLQALLGLSVDVPAAALSVMPLMAGPMSVRGLRIAGQPVDIDVDTEGGVRLSGAASGVGGYARLYAGGQPAS
jgi:glycogen debranching enzyme